MTVSIFLKKCRVRIRAVKTNNGTCFPNYYTEYKKSTNAENPKFYEFHLSCIHYSGKTAQKR